MTSPSATASKPRVHSTAWYDSMYNNRALVPEHAAHFAHWREASQAARAASRCFQDVAYGQGPNESLDIFPAARSAGAKGAPVLVFVHGGSWNSGRPEDYHFIGRVFARAGYVVVLPGYRLGHEGIYPRMLEDGAMAVDWTAKNIARFGGDPDQVVLVGLTYATLSAGWITAG